jgi:hypothetical protein
LLQLAGFADSYQSKFVTLFIDAGNRLTCLPPQLLDITSLRNLFLGANQITELSAGINRLR